MYTLTPCVLGLDLTCSFKRLDKHGGHVILVLSSGCENKKNTLLLAVFDSFLAIFPGNGMDPLVCLRVCLLLPLLLGNRSATLPREGKHIPGPLKSVFYGHFTKPTTLQILTPVSRNSAVFY